MALAGSLAGHHPHRPVAGHGCCGSRRCGGKLCPELGDGDHGEQFSNLGGRMARCGAAGRCLRSGLGRARRTARPGIAAPDRRRTRRGAGRFSAHHRTHPRAAASGGRPAGARPRPPPSAAAAADDRRVAAGATRCHRGLDFRADARPVQDAPRRSHRIADRCQCAGPGRAAAIFRGRGVARLCPPAWRVVDRCRRLAAAHRRKRSERRRPVAGTGRDAGCRDRRTGPFDAVAGSPRMAQRGRHPRPVAANLRSQLRGDLCARGDRDPGRTFRSGRGLCR